jgi:hypothetical protein
VVAWTGGVDGARPRTGGSGRRRSKMLKRLGQICVELEAILAEITMPRVSLRTILDQFAYVSQVYTAVPHLAISY